MSKKKRKKDGEQGNDTQSSEDESSKAEKYSGRKLGVQSYAGVNRDSQHQTGAIAPPGTSQSGR